MENTIDSKIKYTESLSLYSIYNSNLKKILTLPYTITNI